MVAKKMNASSLYLHNIKAFHALGMFSILLFVQRTGAFEFKVGGSDGWSVPGDPNVASYNTWAERNRFQIGDSLLFVYPPNQESVLHVTKEDYTNCNTGTPLEKFTDGHTVFRFNQSGPYYFISGAGDNCHKNEKLVVVVLADRNNHAGAGSHPSPPPAPPLPSGPVEINPSPSPTEESSVASSIAMSFIGSIGAFVASSFLLVFYY